MGEIWKIVWVFSVLSTATMVVSAPAAGQHEGWSATTPLSSVTIWNYVGEPILVHCRDQFTDLEQQDLPHDTDYVFTFYETPDGLTLYSCSFVWGLNKTQEFAVWKGAKVPQSSNPKQDCGAGINKCLYKVTKDGFYMASPSVGHGTLYNWLFVNLWKMKTK